MSCQQSQQKCKLPAKCLPKCPPKCPPQAPAPCPVPCPPRTPSCRIPSCYISGFGDCCCLVPHWFPDVYLGQPQPSTCCDSAFSGCSSCCHGLGGCS